MRPYTFLRRAQGMTLIELAVALLIVGALAMMLGRHVPEQDRNARSMLLSRAQGAVTNFVLTNARLPCPDTNADGYEDCGSSVGLMPWNTVGIDLAEARLNIWIVRYTVHSELSVASTGFDASDALWGPWAGLAQRIQLARKSPTTSQPYLAHNSATGRFDLCSLSGDNLAFGLLVTTPQAPSALPCVQAPEDDVSNYVAMSLSGLEATLMAARH